MKPMMAIGIGLLFLAACSDKADTPQTGSAQNQETGFTRKEIRIVGSSTVYPFATTVAEHFGRNTNFPTPVVESTGSGGGLKLFCAGDGENTPDISNASRRIKKSEVDNCAKNGVTNIVEVKIGFDGIVLANSVKDQRMSINLKDIYLALAKQVPDGKGGLQANPYEKWNDIDPSLPDVKILVLGPPPTSGTRDAFVELAMDGGCAGFPQLAEMQKADKHQFRQICQTIREDGHFVEAGENDNLIVQKLRANPDAFGIFGYSFMEENADVVQGSLIDGKAPTFDDVSSGDYPLSRSLYFYVKKDHVGQIPGLSQYVASFVSDDATGEYGYLGEKGLIPLHPEQHVKWKAIADNMTPMTFKGAE